MLVETSRFGPVDVGEDEILEVPEGIPGFPGLRRVTLLGAGAVPGHDAGDDVHGTYWMQSVDDGSLAFLCIQPWQAFPDYDVEVDAEALDVADPDEVAVLNLVTVRRVQGVATMTANLRAPLVIDLVRRELRQVIIPDTRWSVGAPFAVTVGGRFG